MSKANSNKAIFIIPALILTLLVVILTQTGAGQDQQFEEIVVRFEVPKLFQKDIFVQYDGNNIFLPLIEIFGLLDINVKPNFEKGMFSGKYLTSDTKYEINLPKLRAKCRGKVIELDRTAFYMTQSDLFLRIDLFDSLFNLNMTFDFSRLSVYLPVDKGFPAYQKIKRKAAQEKLLAEKVAVRDIVEIPYKRENFKGGVADWALTINPLEKSGQYLGIGLGGMVLGGDLSLNVAGNSHTGFQADQIRYKWRYAFCDNKFISRAELGDITAGGSLSRGLKGILLTNKPLAQRKFFRTIDVSGNVGEGWEVELYVNNEMTDFAQTDQNGDYSFLVDVNYGSSRIMLKMYGPNGEIRINEEYVGVPYNLIPKGEAEYSVAAGENSYRLEKKRYAQANGYYGVSSGLTVGFCSDFPLGAKDGEKPLFAGEVTYHPFGSLLLNGTFSPDNEIQYSFNYSRPSIISIGGSFTKCYENEFQNKFNRLHNTSLTISSPLKIRGRYLGLRFRLSRDEFQQYKTTNMYYGIKLPLHYFHINYMGSYKTSEYVARTDRKISSQLYISTKMLRWLRPLFKIKYEHDVSRISNWALYLHKRIFRKGQFSLSFEHNAVTDDNRIMATFTIFNRFADFTSRAYISKNHVSFTQTQRGSIRFDQEAGNFRFKRRNGLGHGSAIIRPFLDENYNDILDHGEQLLPELRANIGGATGIRKSRGELYYYDGLSPYYDYIIKIDPYSLDNPMLQPAHENFRVMVSPNSVTSINVPIVTGGEISGIVEREVTGGKSGVGGIRIAIINRLTGKEIVITTFNDGEFFQLGLVPGTYEAKPDQEQLDKYGYISQPPSIKFRVKTVEGGDRIENLNFLIESRK